MNKKVVIFVTTILILGVMPVNSIASNYSEDNKFEIGTGDHELTWNLKSEYNISEIELTTPKAIDVKDVDTSSDKKSVVINLETDGISRGIYVVTANLKPEDNNLPTLSYTVTVMVEMATENEVDDIKDDVENLDDEISDVNNNLNSEMDDMSNKIEEFEDDIDNFKDRLDSIKDDGNQRGAKISKMNSDLSEMTAELDNLKEDLSETEDQVKSVKSSTATGRFLSGASLSIGVFILIVLILYLGFKKGLFKKLIQASQQQYKEKVQKKQPWER
ncbi:MAG: hypothetical protein ABEK36_01785 [Candidatus Aenigmatarchaeota archaeon]